jgi:hypothetical protein
MGSTPIRFRHDRRPGSKPEKKRKKEILMKRSMLTLALAGLVAAGLTARAEDPKPQPKTMTDSTSVKVTILDVNKAKKEVTVKDEAGDVSIVAVPEHFTLEKVKAGDTVTLTYAETLTVGLAKPGDTDAVAAKRTTAGGAGYITKVVTISAMDMSVPSVTFKGADGKSQTVKVRDPKYASAYKVGDKVALTYTGSLNVSIDKK